MGEYHTAEFSTHRIFSYIVVLRFIGEVGSDITNIQL